MIIFGEVERKMNKRKDSLKEAGVILTVLVMIFSSTAAMAVTIKSVDKPKNLSVYQELVWDNVIGVYGADGGIFVATERPDGTAEPADDFQLETEHEVDSIYWQGGYFQCELAQGMIDYDWDWRIIFWDDYIDGSHPGNEIYNQTIKNTSITREPWYTWTNTSTGRQYWVANYSAELPEPITFEANKKYWITIRGIGAYPPQACWVRHNISDGGIKLHEAVFRGALWGYPDWVNISFLTPDHLPHDFNFQLFGPAAPPNNPPAPPTIKGPNKIKPKAVAEYTLNSVDPDDDDVYYYVDWGDGNNSGWIGPSSSGVNKILNHTWTVKGNYTIKAKAKDIFDAESAWTEYEVAVPRAKIIYDILQQILKRFFR